MIITGIVKEYLSVGNKVVMPNICISPDITGLIIGIDWLEQQGKFVWDFRKQRIQFGNADGLSRRPEATESDTDSQLNMKPIGRVSKIESAEGVEPSLVRENLPELQRADPELGRIIQLRLACTERPTNNELQEDSKITKKLANSWDYLE